MVYFRTYATIPLIQVCGSEQYLSVRVCHIVLIQMSRVSTGQRTESLMLTRPGGHLEANSSSFAPPLLHPLTIIQNIADEIQSILASKVHHPSSATRGQTN